jgi:hypothetical protein
LLGAISNGYARPLAAEFKFSRFVGVLKTTEPTDICVPASSWDR